MSTIYCPTCSQDDFEQALYSQAVDGDTIVLPAGSATWGNSSRPNAGIIYIILEITVEGQGDSTVITIDDTAATYTNGVVALWAPSVFKSIKVIDSVVSPTTFFNLSAFTGITRGFRISNITYEGGLDGYFAYVSPSIKNCTIDHCRFNGGVAYKELIFARGDTSAWQSPSNVGTQDNVFIQDCEFNTDAYICDANANSCVVVRKNLITGASKADAHGLASNSPAASVRSFEVYDNTWTKTGAGNWSNIEVRGGTAMVFNNTCETGWFFLHDYAYDSEPRPWENFGYEGSSTLGNPTTITTVSPNGYVSGWPVWVQAPLSPLYGFYTISVTGPTTFTIPVNTSVSETLDYAGTYKTPFDYPIKQQVGQGEEGEAMEPAYIFGNTQNGSSWPRTLGTVCADALIFYQAQTANPAATFTDQDVIQSNRDFYSDSGFDAGTGVSVGTFSDMEAFSAPFVGYGWWVTDRGNWDSTLPANTSGELRVWDGADWILYYTPYDYPGPWAPSDNSSITAASVNFGALTIG